MSAACRTRLLLASLLSLLLAGCWLEAPSTSAPPVAPPADADGRKWSEVFLQGTKVGYVGSGEKWTEQEGRRVREATMEVYQKVARLSQVIEVRAEYRSVEDEAGQLQSFEYRLTTGKQPIHIVGRVEGGKIVGENRSGEKPAPFSVECPAQLGGFDAIEVALRKKPLAPLETRTIHAVHGGLTVGFETQELTARNWEEVMIGGAARRMLRVDATTSVGGQPMESRLWCDERGEIWKTTMPAMQQMIVRATREQAQSGLETAQFDLGAFSLVRAKLGVRDPHATKRAVYRVQLKESDPAKVFAAGLSQEVKPLDRQTAELTVRAVRPDQPAVVPAKADRQPEAGDREPNTLVQSDDPAVVLLATSVANNEHDPWKIATALEKLVRSKMKSQATSQAFASAAEVAKSLEGDCTEYGVLLAALCRARGIPARVALGLVYYPPQEGFAYHLWTEVWINDRWVPLDATLARGGIGAAHIKISDTNLRGASATSAFLPVLGAIGQMKLEVVEVE